MLPTVSLDPSKESISSFYKCPVVPPPPVGDPQGMVDDSPPFEANGPPCSGSTLKDRASNSSPFWDDPFVYHFAARVFSVFLIGGRGAMEAFPCDILTT